MLKPLVPFFSWRSCQSPPWLAAAPHTFFQSFRELLLHAAAVTTTSGIPPCDQGTIGTSRGMPPFQRFKKHGTHHKHSQTEKNCMQYWKYWQMYVDYLNISESYWDILRIQEKSTAPSTAEHLRVSHGWLRKQIQWPPTAPRRTAAWTTGLGKL